MGHWLGCLTLAAVGWGGLGQLPAQANGSAIKAHNMLSASMKMSQFTDGAISGLTLGNSTAVSDTGMALQLRASHLGSAAGSSLPQGAPERMPAKHPLRSQRVTPEETEIEETEIEETEIEETASEAQSDVENNLDEDLGILRVRSRDFQIDEELGLIRIWEPEELPIEQIAQPPAPKFGFVTGRASLLGGSNLFRLPDPIDERAFQVGTGFYLVPKLAPDTNLVLGAEGNLVRYREFPSVDYNELQIQAGIRQRINDRTFGQLTWRNQSLYTPNESIFFSADYIELLLSRRDLLTRKLWLDSYYQARVSFSHPDRFSRFSQLGIAALNYGFTPQFRTSLIYQLFLDDYTQVRRHDTYHQVIGQLTYDITPSSRFNLFGGVKFGRSSNENVDFDEVIYGASFNFNVPVF